MKTSVLLFLAGVALGVAATLALRPTDRMTEPEISADSAILSRKHSAEFENIPTRDGRPRKKDPRRHRAGGNPQTDLEELLTSLSAIDDETQLDFMLLIRQASMLTKLGEAEAIDLLNQLTQPPADEPDHDRSEFNQIASAIIFARLCELNGPEAMRMAAEGQLLKDLDEEVVAMGMNSWVAADPEGAQRWFNRLVGDADKILQEQGDDAEFEGMMEFLDIDELRQAYFNGMAKYDPDGLRESVAQFNSDDVRETLQEDLKLALINQEGSAAGLINLLGNPEEAPSAWTEGVIKLVKVDSQAAATWAESLQVGGPRDIAINRIGPALVAANGQEGVDWYLSQQLDNPQGDAQRYSVVASHMAKNDYQQAGEWVEQQPDDAIRDRAEIQMATIAIGKQNWNQAMSWAAGVTDETQRNRTLQQAFRNGWDQSTQQLKPEVMQAAESAGFGESAKAYKR